MTSGVKGEKAVIGHQLVASTLRSRAGAYVSDLARGTSIAKFYLSMKRVAPSFLLSIVLFAALAMGTSACSKNRGIDDPNVRSLADMISPEELAEEMKVDKNTRAKQEPNFSARLQIIIDKAKPGAAKTAQRMYVFLDGQRIYNWNVSTGRETMETSVSGKRYRSSTPRGIFRIYRRVKNYFSKTWEAPMPYAQFLIGGIAIHATTESHYDELGKRASGGCVRLRFENAKKLWALVTEVGITEVVVQIFDSGLGEKPSLNPQS